MKHDVAAVIRRTRASFAQGRPTTAREALVLVEATRQAAHRSRQHIAGLQTSSLWGDEPERQRATLLRALARLNVRLDGYAEALAAVAPSSPPPDAVAPLLRNLVWPKDTPTSLRHFTPDFATPFTLDNQAGELQSFGAFQTKAFLRYVQEAAAALKRAAAGAAKAAADAAAEAIDDAGDLAHDAAGGSVWPWVLGTGVVLGVGGMVALRLYGPRL
ncbi:MAG: hypothetical protein AAGA54_35295 [Myxococcota bacterium]